jgi:vacuolar-type H+-ATPase subunit E/Vma4
MSIERLEQAVLAEAEAAAARIIQDARRSQAQILAEWDRDCEATYAEAVAAAEAAAAREIARHLSGQRHKGRLAVLAAKNGILEAVFARAAEMLSSLPSDDYMRLMESWLVRLPNDASGVLRIAPKDAERFTADFLGAVNAKRPDGGKFTGVEADAAVRNGFVLEAESFRIDCTVETAISGLRAEMAGELAARLFGDKA